ncbi:MAG: MBL fold metallo-hydrolase [Kiritimatiellia bacterium]|nr:MBL fold metallo-hydrolase [Kiritimatiellia bacterium]MDP6630548.1 MBL fold metallo-hydrolase [Kiritimatiellia bacterium]MDP6811222.1 MBL fold metallo-hydrolase [Kiritimatiellia bacterium]MDP7024333.1 MBL fold metallo-hydrolase [Kiritimatiellia bacterium]
MAIRVCVLASGSKGNCTVMATESTRILIDAGLSGKETDRRLRDAGWELDQVDAICVSHEHDDHKASLGILQRRLGVPLYSNAGTIEALERSPKHMGLDWHVFTNGSAFQVGDMQVEPFSVPHDSYDPVGFAVVAQGVRVGIVTDMGTPTELIRQRLKGCSAIVLEANHDEGMLRDAPRPWSLKQRIAGRQGHLSNTQAGELLAEIADEALNVVFLAHLSADCNKPDIAEQTIREALDQAGHTHVQIRHTYPDRISDVVELG